LYSPIAARMARAARCIVSQIDRFLETIRAA
jgi:hypothetical protein